MSLATLRPIEIWINVRDTFLPLSLHLSLCAVPVLSLLIGHSKLHVPLCTPYALCD